MEMEGVGVGLFWRGRGGEGVGVVYVRSGQEGKEWD